MDSARRAFTSFSCSSICSGILASIAGEYGKASVQHVVLYHSHKTQLGGGGGGGGCGSKVTFGSILKVTFFYRLGIISHAHLVLVQEDIFQFHYPETKFKEHLVTSYIHTYIHTYLSLFQFLLYPLDQCSSSNSHFVR